MPHRVLRYSGQGTASAAIVIFLIISACFAPSAWACRCTRTAEVTVDRVHPDVVVKVDALANRIARAVATPCFVIGPIRPEYELRLTVEIFDQENGKMIPGFSDELTQSKYFPGKMARAVIPDKYGPFFSEATLTLYYTGGDPGQGKNQIAYWRSFAETRDLDEHEALLVAEVNAGPPLHELAWDYEADGETFEISVDDPCVDPNSDVIIKRESVRDWRGRACGAMPLSGHTRFVIHPDDEKKGGMAQGDQTNDGAWAFLHESCDREYTYRTPMEEDMKWNEIPITAYQSCDVLRQSVKPMADTSRKTKLSKIIIRNKKRLPYDCAIKPPRTPIRAGKTATIEIKDIVDEHYDLVHPYDRIFVRAGKGKIVNGKSLGGMHAFDVGESGKIKVTYRAPANCKITTDTLYVHTSCSTSEKPAEEPGAEIASEKLAITCGYAATVTGRHKGTRRTSYDNTSGSGDRDHHDSSDDSQVEATIQMALTPSGTEVNKGTETMFRTFKVDRCTLSSYSFNSETNTVESHSDADGKCSYTRKYSKNGIMQNPQARCEGTLSIAFDTKTGKAKYVSLPVLGVDYEGSVRIEESVGGCNSSSSDNTLSLGKHTVPIGPPNAPTGEDIAKTAAPELAQIQQMAREMEALGKQASGMSPEQMEAFVKQFEKKYDPDAIAKSMEPKLVSSDLKVTGGDGKTNLSGGGSKTDRKQIDGGFMETVNELKWRIYMKAD